MRKQMVMSLGCALSLATFAGAREAHALEETHDGFYLQMAIGPGYLSASAEQGPMEVSFGGATVSSHLMIGGSLMPGLVLGGGFINDYAFSPSYKLNDQEPVGLDDVSLYLISIGAFVDFYPNPTKGLHFQGFAGWGGLESSSNGNSGGSDPTGLVVTVGAGYEWWVAKEWGVGILGRFGYAPLSLNDVSYSTISPALLATFTYN
jgi:hypothetical protein